MTTGASLEQGSHTGNSPSAGQACTDAMSCCETGDLTRLKEFLNTQTVAVEKIPSAHDMLLRACDARKPDIVRFLVEEHPDIETTLQLHKTAFSGGVEIYAIILEKYPTLKLLSFGHTSDPISEAVLNNDIRMLDFLLAQGFEAKDSHYCYVPVTSLAISPSGISMDKFWSS